MRGTRIEARLLKSAERFIPAYAGNTYYQNRKSKQRRFIPAYAGNTWYARRSGICEAVHPRVCGEHLSGSMEQDRFCGSSPRMRGTRRAAAGARGFLRFIPAYAGNTPAPNRKWSGRTVHPRVCGEHIETAGRYIGKYGSSPRMRGTPTAARGAQPCNRFIPAYAGNTCASMMRMFRNAVHPRVCGEHARPKNRRPPCAGSSPRMRGTHSPWTCKPLQCRFIPAYAGNTALKRCARGRRSVHPRVCGEHKVFVP